MLIPRHGEIKRLADALARSRVVALLGPRQCGKTTLVQMFIKERTNVHFFDLEDPTTLAVLDEPMTALGPLTGIVVIDEIQRRPELFPILRVLADRRPLPAKFIILGSASPNLLRQSSESLAGRIEKLELSGFSIQEVGTKNADHLWLSGGLPPSFLASDDEKSFIWRRQFIQTFLERDIPLFGIRVAATTLWRFWAMLAHYHGNVWNASELARSLGVNETTTRKYLDILESLYMVRVLQPWHANLKKRQVKSPKVYIRDTGILHALLGIRTFDELRRHPKRGASWEGLAVETCIRSFLPDDVAFWGTHGGAEIDLVIIKGGRMTGVECKLADAPRMTASIRHAIRDLDLESVWVIYPGAKRYRLDEKVQVIPLKCISRLKCHLSP